MAENKKPETSAMHHVPQATDNTMVLRVPKPNIQVVVLGLVAFITLFQTFQLVRISGSANTGAVKSVPAATTSGGSGANADAPQSMVGGC